MDTSLSPSDLVADDLLRRAVDEAAYADEAACVERLIEEADGGRSERGRIEARAVTLVEGVRARQATARGLDAFLQEYDLSSREGVILMCLAEALLRIPDGASADRLIAEKLGSADWKDHLGRSTSAFVNASTWALMLTGRLVRVDEATADAKGIIGRLISRSGEPIVRKAILQALRIMGRQFVMGRKIGEALARARDSEAKGYRHSYDMLGESARTTADALRYVAAYQNAIGEIGKAAAGRGPIEGPGVSIKLSALHPRMELTQRERVMAELLPRLTALARQAREANIGFCIDTEESERLDITLDVFTHLCADEGLSGWGGLGVAIQAYQKRARAVIDWLIEIGERRGGRLSVRLVKGAYWDSEIKRAQELGLDGYPVFTRKANTDTSYLACARKILSRPDVFYGQFATHNAHTVAAVREIAEAAAGKRADAPISFEFQRLHGMGQPLYEAVMADGKGISCRVYAPVGKHEDLLAYLVRRLLENGANTSFVNRIAHSNRPAAELVADPVTTAASYKAKSHPRIPAPRDLFAGERLSARGLDLGHAASLRDLMAALTTEPSPEEQAEGTAAPIIAGEKVESELARPVTAPADRRRTLGTVIDANDASIDRAIAAAADAFSAWDTCGAETRAAILEAAADAMEADTPAWMRLLIDEGGKTINDALSEVREAVDFCRYYAARGRADFGPPMLMPGPTGERNELALRGRGVFACISPWNFPLAIFLGQVTAALMAGNAVIAKPAEQTPLIAARAVDLLHRAGVPAGALNLLPGDGRVGQRLVSDPRIAGVAFTGSVATANAINRTLAARNGPIVPLIAETGGLNAMIVDSTALPEQVATDVITSAFRSAGQRCSALRVLFVQKNIEARVVDLIAGAMLELRVGDPANPATDVGPIIDEEARSRLVDHARGLEAEGRLIARAALTPECEWGTFFPPVAFHLDRLSQLEEEIFGPILHVIPFASGRLGSVIEAIDQSGYGLTLGIHSRVEGVAAEVKRRLGIGNTYVNRNMIGAVVGVQPFGGERLSGTGPKAGGPRYLHRFAVERTLTANLTAAGGNMQLLSLSEDEA